MGGAPSPENGLTVRLERQAPYLRLESVNIFVRDIDRSLRFYVEQLGFNLAFDARSQSRRRWVAVSPPDGAATLTLVEPDPGSEEAKLIGRTTQIAFVTEDVMVKFRDWRRQGVQFLYTPRLRRLRRGVRVARSRAPEEPTSREEPIWGGVFTRFLDPDGNSFTLVSFDEVSREIEAQRRLAAERIEAERRAAQELEIAKQVQARLFPQTLPSLRTLDYAGACIQARQVGGDYYDFLDLGGERLGLVVGDICGKGIAAALLMANLQATLRSQCAIAADQPESFLRSVNQLLYVNTDENTYVTLFFAEYDDRKRRLRYASCGHLAALLLRRDGALEQLPSTCTVLGLFDDWECETSEQQLEPGDTLVLYTDGVTEAFDAREQQFGEERLVDALRRHRNQAPPELLGSILADVHRFSTHEQHDDLTLIVAKCRPDAEGERLRLV